MATPVILVLGDISGYTRFIRFHSVSLVHAEKIISELLEEVIASASPPLVLKELDGDAVTFSALDENRDDIAMDILSQAEFCIEAFRRRLAELMSEASICLCDACSRVGQLKLKMIIHRGEATFDEVRGFPKVGGEDIILAHRLLKNSIQSDEYILMTDRFAQGCTQAGLSIRPVEVRKEQVEGFGEVDIHVINYEQAGEPEPIQRPFSTKLQMFGKLEKYLVGRLFSKSKKSYPNLSDL